MIQIERGYQGVFCGDWLFYGNGEVRARNLITGEDKLIATEAACCGWRSVAGRIEVAVSEYTGTAQQPLRQLAFYDLETNARTPSLIPQTELVGTNPQIAVQNVRIMSGRPPRVGAGLIEDWDGHAFVYPVQAADGAYTFIVEDADSMGDRSIPGKLQNPKLNRLSNGSWLSWNHGGRMHVSAPDGTRYEGPDGEYRGFVEEAPNGTIHAWTYVTEGMTPVLLGRPIGTWTKDDPAVIVRDVGVEGIQHRHTPEGTELCGFVGGEGHGRLTVTLVPFNAPRLVYVKPVEPSPVLPAITYPVLSPRWRGCLGGADGAPGNFGGGDRTTGHILEGIGVYTRAPRAGQPWIAVAHQDRWRWIFTSPKEGGDQEQQDAKVQAKLTGGMIVVYDDAGGDTFHYLDLSKALKASGFAVCPMVLVRPLSPTDTAEAIVGRMRTALASLLAEGFDWCGVMRRVDVGAAGDWPGLLVADASLAVTAALEAPELAHVKLDCCYGSGDGRFVWGMDYERALCTATTAPTDAIPRTPVNTVPTPIPTPPVVTPPVVPPEPIWRRYITDSEIERRRREREAMGQPT